MNKSTNIGISKNNFILGEYTTNSGPIDDDHFLVIIDEFGNENEFTIGKEECDNAIQKIEKIIGTKIEFGLSNSTEFASLIHWPKELKNKKLYEIVEHKNKGWKKIFSFFKLFGYSNLKVKYAKEVINKLETNRNKQKGVRPL